MPPYTYKASGVDIDRADNLVSFIAKRARKTARPGNASVIGSFAALFDLKKENFKDPLLVTSTDGVGTKLRIAIEAGKHDTIGIDLVAMCVNDILVHGATPLFFLDYFAMAEISARASQDIIDGIVRGCEQAGCSLVGGETAQMPGMYERGDYDLAGFVVGAVERNKVLPLPNIEPGMRLLGIKSSGLHSNGFSLVRHFINDRGIDLKSKCPFDPSITLGEALLEPTRIYVKALLPILAGTEVLGMAHITGGGITENLPRILPSGVAARVSSSAWEKPPVYNWLITNGLNVEKKELYRVFNMGIGMVLVVNASSASSVATAVRNAGEVVYDIGEIVPSAEPEPHVIWTDVGEN
jgi:phosphoribosylformylglycinamidine cyclo-ligase